MHKFKDGLSLSQNGSHFSSNNTRRSAEHCTLHADGARLAYFIDFRMIKLYLLPNVGKVWKR